MDHKQQVQSVTSQPKTGFGPLETLVASRPNLLCLFTTKAERNPALVLGTRNRRRSRPGSLILLTIDSCLTRVVLQWYVDSI